ncbi:DNA-binding transcription repressor [Coemansia sp. RSA 2424]|nr:DNA-binding transcription repressor [Coemansia sp. RSA 2424]
MATAYHRHHSRGAPPARHKRKGIPTRSPCQRDMAEAPGVVFRFPDKIAAISSPQDLSTAGVSGLNILPSSAGLPSGLGAKTAASVIAAAAAAASAVDTIALPPPTSAAPTSTPLADCSAPEDGGSGGSQANSASSTPLLKPVLSTTAITAAPIHRSASNVLHYPELLSDLRDRLIQIHQVSHHHASHHVSSGVESDGNNNNAHSAQQQQSIKRARVKRMAGAAGPQRQGVYTSPGARRSGLRGNGAAAALPEPQPLALLHTTLAAAQGHAAAGGHGSAAVGRSRSELSSAEHGLVANLAASAAKAAEAAGFQRRHSIGAVQAQLGVDDNDEILDIMDSESTASSSGQQQRRHANQPHGQVGAGGRHPQAGGMAAAVASGRGAAAVPRLGPPAAGPKRKRDKEPAMGDRRSGSPLAHPYHAYHHHQRYHPQPQPKRALPPAPPQQPMSPMGSSFGGSKRCCASCGASSTPCWRPGLIDSMTLCNLCGLRYKKGKVYCASCSYVPTKTEIATGGASICRRCSSSIHMPSVAAVPGASPSSSPMPGGVPAPHSQLHHRHNAGF